ncbi:MAG: selenocysteine-specific translation elongation factor [Thermoleophilaceae bacterium]
MIRALTGKNTDRLPEERSRGISIELGYAPLELPSGRQLSVVDVPGHERFVRTMVAGASGVDMFLLCVAADDGVMPQTREHMAVLRQLGVSVGVVAVTKADIGEPDIAAAEAAELAPGVPVVHVSAVSGAGLDELRAELDRAAGSLPGRAGGGDQPRLHVDRSFTLKGIGTVVTGTLWSGSIAADDSVVILPRGLEARVRSVQVHDASVERAAAGQRVALNLARVGWREVGRGDVVVAPGSSLRPSYLLDAAIALEPGAPAIEDSTRVQVHHGTRDAPGRVVPLGEGYAQIRLEAPLMAAAGDRVILRQVAPPDTIGGAVVVDPTPRKHGARPEVVERLAAIERGEAPPEERREREPLPSVAEPEPEPLDDAALRIASILRSDGATPRTDAELAEAAELPPAEAADRLRRLERAGQAVRVGRNLHFHPEPLAELEARVVAMCERDGRATIASVRDELATSRKYAQALLEHLDAQKVTVRRGDEHVLRRRG